MTSPESSPQPKPSTDELIESICRLQEDVRHLKGKQKDGWDKFQIIAALLIPASIALVGFLVSNASKEAEIRSSENIAKGQRDASNAQLKISQAELVNSFLSALLSPEAQTRKLAVEAILIALPKNGPRLVEIIAASDPDPKVKDFASGLLGQRELILKIFSLDHTESDKARDAFIASGRSTTSALVSLAQATIGNKSNTHGVANALTILTTYGPKVGTVWDNMLPLLLTKLDADDPELSDLLETLRKQYEMNRKNP